MAIRGIRGATTVESDRRELVLSATQELIRAILNSNPGLQTEEIGCAIFTMTEDLISVYPALAARQVGWEHVPMICVQEIPIVGSLPRCIRILIQWNTEKPSADIRHVYMHEAVSLRPDLVVP